MFFVTCSLSQLHMTPISLHFLMLSFSLLMVSFTEEFYILIWSNSSFFPFVLSFFMTVLTRISSTIKKWNCNSRHLYLVLISRRELSTLHYNFPPISFNNKFWTASEYGWIGQKQEQTGRPGPVLRKRLEEGCVSVQLRFPHLSSEPEQPQEAL